MDLELLETTPSTMDEARARLAAGRVSVDPDGKLHPAGVLAREQTAGRGQRGRAWYSPPSGNLYATLYLPTGAELSPRVGEIAFVAAVAAAEALAALPACDVGLKWPNDILLAGKKAGGILVEMAQSAALGWVALIGIGINLAARPLRAEIAAAATSLEAQGVIPPPAPELASRIAGELWHWEEIRRADGFAVILDRWRVYDQTPGRRYRTGAGGVELEGTATSVSAAGALEIELADGARLTVTSASSISELTNAAP